MGVVFRPSARLVSTIGEDIIKDMHAAIVELVKNAYDADASIVEIEFSEKNDMIFISVFDDGHGMSKNDVVNKWLVPSTGNKQVREKSPKGRAMQGRKGIGRFAAQILGEDLLLETVQDGEKSIVKIDWTSFEGDKFLDEIAIELQTSETKKKNGTHFFISGSEQKLVQWNEIELDALIKDLRKMLIPIEEKNDDLKNNQELKREDSFQISIGFQDFSSSKYSGKTVRITPLPLLNYYNYRLYGKIFSNGEYELTYHNNETGVTNIVDDFAFIFEKDEKLSSELQIDLRVFDRDPESIDYLVNHLELEHDGKIGKNEARRMLNDISGVSIYRNNFRIRPYGDLEYDWLELDKKRVQSSTKIGHNQISGNVFIGSEEDSNLVEKSARDGLKEDVYYDGLVEVVSSLISYIEVKRYAFREKTGKGRKPTVVNEQLRKLLDYSEIDNMFKHLMVSNDSIDEKNLYVQETMRKVREESEKAAHELEMKFLLYQGQATLGRVVDIVMHEARKPVAWLGNQGESLQKMSELYKKTKNSEILERMLIEIEKFPSMLNELKSLFSRIDPLATRQASAKKQFSLFEVVDDALNIYTATIKREKISVKMNVDKTLLYFGWENIMLFAISNIVENAIYWVSTIPDSRVIEIKSQVIENCILLEIYNNGPFIINDLLEKDTLFEPGISAKSKGTGLGLSIAGNGVERHGGKLKAANTEDGVLFVIELPIKKEG